MAEAYTMPVNYGADWYIPVEISYYPGEDNTVMMRWQNHWKYTSSFDVFWRFSLTNGKFIDETSTVSVIPDNMSYQAKTSYDPKVTKTVTGWIRPREAEDLKVWGYLCPWSPSQAGASLSPMDWRKPDSVSTPSCAIDDYTLEMESSVSRDPDSSTGFDLNATHIEFQVVNQNGGILLGAGDVSYATSVGSSNIKDLLNNKRPNKNISTPQIPNGLFPVNRTTGTAKTKITLSSGLKIRVRARGVNNTYGVKGEWSDYTSYIETPPVSTEITSLKSLTPTSVQVVVKKVDTAKRYEVNYTSNIEDFKTDSGTSTTFEGTTINIEGLESGHTWYFRARSVNDAGESRWSEVKNVTLGIRPSPPTTWSNVVTAKIGEDIVLNWTHNSRDGSSMQKAQIEMVTNGDLQIITVEGKKDTDTQEWLDTLNYTIDSSKLPDNTTIRWRVRTRGVLEDYSDWSITREIKVYVPPSVTVVPYKTQEPTGDPLTRLDSFPFYIVATANPSTQRSIAFHVSIVSNSDYRKMAPNGDLVWVSQNEEVYSRYFDYDGSLEIVEFGDEAVVTNNVLTLKLMPSDVDFEPGIAYTIKASVAMDNGLSADGYNIFTVTWEDQTMYPVADIFVDTDQYTATIVPYCTVETTPEQMEEMSEQGLTNRDLPLLENVKLAVYRIEYDGNMVLIMDEIDNDRSTAIIDPHPPLNFARYRIVATDQKTGAIGFVDSVPVEVGGLGIVIQWDETWNNLYTNPYSGIVENAAAWTGSRLVLPANVDTSEGNKIDKTLVEYIGGRHPVSYYGTQIGTTATWNAVFPKSDTETLDILRRLSAYVGDVYVREPKGAGYWATIDVSYNIQHLNLIIPVTVTVTRVEGGI